MVQPEALLAGVLAVSMAVTPMTTAFAGTGAQAAVAQQDAEEASDEVVLADFDLMKQAKTQLQRWKCHCNRRWWQY